MRAYRGGQRPARVAYRDFRPKMLDAGGLVTGPTFEPFESAVEEANSWLEQSGVTLVGVETVLLPNLTILSETTTPQTARFDASAGANWYQVVRVWFQAG